MSYDFDITECGAVPDGETMNTAAIQKAIDSCSEAGGGRVVCGPGNFLTGALHLISDISFSNHA